MTQPPAFRPAVHAGSDQPDTHLGRPGDGSRLLVERRLRERPAVTATLLLIGGSRAPGRVRDHIVRTLAMEEVAAAFHEDGADLRVTVRGPADAVEGAVDTIPRLYLALRRAR
ncbi:MAG: hypothetical protein Q8P41_18155 [Pseudomonadota bacterium]|nr:hypothetical protein [Pseudomonadota bacterium]